MRRPAALLCAVVALAACDAAEPAAAPPTCAGDDLLPAADCCPAGTAPAADGACCPAGTTVTPDGCIEAGVPPELCAEGFTPDGNHGCAPVLPPTPCGPGQLALAGEVACRDVAPCGAAPWGDAPRDAGTQHVDAAYAGAASDGSAAFPWTRVQAAIDAAAPGAAVAIAAGRYPEDLRIEGKAVRLQGRCPGLVELAGVAPGGATLLVLTGAAGTSVTGLAITGPNLGLLLSGATDVSLERLWLHDLGGRGLEASDDLGPSSATLRDTLVERTRDVAVGAFGLPLTIENTVIRATALDDAGTHGWGLLADESTHSGLPAQLVVVRSQLEASSAVGLQVTGSEVSLEGTLIQGTLPEADGSRGTAVDVRAGAGGRRSVVHIRSSLLADNREVGVFVEGSDVTLDGAVVRGTLPNAAGAEGHNLFAQPDPSSGARATLTLSRCLVDGGHATGLSLRGADATVLGTRIRDTRGDGGNGGMGIGALADTTHGASTLVVRDAVLERNLAAGILLAGATAEVDHTAVHDTRSTPAGSAGHGLHVKPSTETSAPGSLRLTRSSLTGNQGGGLMVLSATATVDLTHIADTLPYDGGQYGVGVGVFLDPRHGVAGHVDLTRTLLEKNHDAGLIVWGSTASLQGCVVLDTRADARGRFGDGVQVALSGASVQVADSRIRGSARAGISSFGGAITLEGVTLSCNTIDLNGERDLPAGGTDTEASFDDRGGNVCGCDGEPVACGVASSGLEAPAPIDETLP